MSRQSRDWDVDRRLTSTIDDRAVSEKGTLCKSVGIWDRADCIISVGGGGRNASSVLVTGGFST